MMRVSIITPTFNSSKHLQECIDSVKTQSYPNIEHIIIDNKSEDGTLEIIKNNESHLAFWISEADRGMYDAINKGILKATGEIIGILNSDDILASTDAIQWIVDAFQQQNTDSVYGDLVFVDDNDPNIVYRRWISSDFNRKKFLHGWMPAHPTFYIKRELIEKYGNYENHFYSAADYEFMCRYLYKYKLSAFYIPRTIVRMRKGGLSNGNLKSRIRANRRDFLAMKKNGIPFPFFVSILKPLLKLDQYNFRKKFFK